MVFPLPVANMLASYFGDVKDGGNGGDENDPLMSIIRAVQNEIAYWVSTGKSVIRAAEASFDAVSERSFVRGELRALTAPDGT